MPVGGLKGVEIGTYSLRQSNWTSLSYVLDREGGRRPYEMLLSRDELSFLSPKVGKRAEIKSLLPPEFKVAIFISIIRRWALLGCGLNPQERDLADSRIYSCSQRQQLLEGFIPKKIRPSIAMMKLVIEKKKVICI